MITYCENNISIRIRPVYENGMVIDLQVSVDFGKWEFTETYPQIDAWSIWHEFSE